MNSCILTVVFFMKPTPIVQIKNIEGDTTQSENKVMYLLKYLIYEHGGILNNLPV